jgi:hypothetical protein
MKCFIVPAVVCAAACLIANAETGALLDSQAEQALHDWTFEFGVSLMTKNELDDFLSGQLSIEEGDAGAEVYQVTATKKLRELDWEVFGHVFKPLLEMPLCLELVDEHAESPFLVYNAALQLRWVDFPWNSYVRTGFAAGLGLSYASQIYAIDRQRHPGEDRSNLKLTLPIQFAFKLPSNHDDELRFYLAHHSGGFGIFDEGGFNSLGIAFSRSF